MNNLPPVEALQAIRRVLADASMHPAEKCATIGVILKADNRTGEAWADHQKLCTEFHLSKHSVARALGTRGETRGKAIGRHLELARRGEHGAHCYAVQKPAEQTTETASPARQKSAPAVQKSVLAVQKSAEQTHSNSISNSSSGNRGAAGKPPPDPRVRAFLDYFCQAYKERHSRDYLVNGGKDGETIKRLLSALDKTDICALAALKKAARTMLADEWGGPKASIGLLSSQLNTWRGDGPGKRRGRRFTPQAGDDYSAVVVGAAGKGQ